MSISPHDPRLLAKEVRALATQAYETLHDPLADAQDTCELSQRIANLQGVIEGLGSDDLSLWLENLRRRIETPEKRSNTGRPIRSSSPSD